MSGATVLVRGGALADGTVTDVAVEDGIVVAIGPELPGAAGSSVIEAGGLVVLPGVIDAHVHLNDPGRADWEGFATGTRALAAGGTTCAIDMPLNAHPPTVDAASFDRKVAAADGQLHVDVALWGGIVPGNLDDLDELAARGVVGFKAFMANSGIEDFAAADELTLLDGMGRAASLGLPVAVHAESDALTAALAARAVAQGRTAMADYLASRPVLAELEAISRAILMADDVGCALHVVHVSSGRGAAIVAVARAHGMDVTSETCPHYLALDADDAVRLGPLAKCAPPLRPGPVVADLWEHVMTGQVDLIATDHSPAPMAMKQGDDAFAVWGGISGAQTLLSIMLSEGVAARGLELPALTRLLAAAPAARFGLAPAKGTLAVGADADLVLVDPSAQWTLTREALHDRHRLSPFVGRSLTGRVTRTVLRGETVAVDGTPVGEPRGRIVGRA